MKLREEKLLALFFLLGAILLVSHVQASRTKARDNPKILSSSSSASSSSSSSSSSSQKKEKQEKSKIKDKEQKPTSFLGFDEVIPVNCGNLQVIKEKEFIGIYDYDEKTTIEIKINPVKGTIKIDNKNSFVLVRRDGVMVHPLSIFRDVLPPPPPPKQPKVIIKQIEPVSVTKESHENVENREKSKLVGLTEENDAKNSNHSSSEHSKDDNEGHAQKKIKVSHQSSSSSSSSSNGDSHDNGNDEEVAPMDLYERERVMIPWTDNSSENFQICQGDMIVVICPEDPQLNLRLMDVLNQLGNHFPTNVPNIQGSWDAFGNLKSASVLLFGVTRFEDKTFYSSSGPSSEKDKDDYLSSTSSEKDKVQDDGNSPFIFDLIHQAHPSHIFLEDVHLTTTSTSLSIKRGNIMGEISIMDREANLNFGGGAVVAILRSNSLLNDQVKYVDTNYILVNEEEEPTNVEKVKLATNDIILVVVPVEEKAKSKNYGGEGQDYNVDDALRVPDIHLNDVVVVNMQGPLNQGNVHNRQNYQVRFYFGDQDENNSSNDNDDFPHQVHDHNHNHEQEDNDNSSQDHQQVPNLEEEDRADDNQHHQIDDQNRNDNSDDQNDVQDQGNDNDNQDQNHNSDDEIPNLIIEEQEPENEQIHHTRKLTRLIDLTGSLMFNSRSHFPAAIKEALGCYGETVIVLAAMVNVQPPKEN